MKTRSLIPSRRPPQPRKAEAAYLRWSRSVVALWSNRAQELLERSRTELVTRAQIDAAWDELLAGAGLTATLLRASAEITRANATYFRSVLKTTPPGHDVSTIRRAWLTENLILWDKLGAELADRLAAALAQPRLDAKPAGVTRAVNAARKENVALIKGIDPGTARTLGAALKSAQEQGVRHEELIDQVTQITGYGGARACLIARDQTMKYNSSVMQSQARAAGITQYRWRVVRDEATRPYHKRLDGTVHSWNDPPITNAKGDRNHPGEDYQCRCTPEPVIELFAGLDDGPDLEPVQRAPEPAAPPRAARAPAAPKRMRATVARAEAGLTEGELAFARTGYREPLEIYRDVPPEQVDAVASGAQPAPGSGAPVPPIQIAAYPDGTLVLVDGRHRLEAAQRAGAKRIRARLVQYDPDLRAKAETERVIPVPAPDEAKRGLLSGGPRP